MFEETKVQNGIAYHFSTRIRPGTAHTSSNNKVIHNTNSPKCDGTTVTLTHHNSILDKDTKNHNGRWAIYSELDHKVDGIGDSLDCRL